MSPLYFGFVAYCANELAEQDILRARSNEVKSQRRTSPGTINISPFLSIQPAFAKMKTSIQGQAEICSRLVYLVIQGNDYM